MHTLVRKPLQRSDLMMVPEDATFAVFCPYASRFPFESWIVPRTHASHFEDIDDDALLVLARVVKESIKRIGLALDQPSYNLVLHTVDLKTMIMPR